MLCRQTLQGNRWQLQYCSTGRRCPALAQPAITAITEEDGTRAEYHDYEQSTAASLVYPTELTSISQLASLGR